MSVEEADALLVAAGLPPGLAEKIHAAADVGRYTIQTGELDYSIGALTQQIEFLREGCEQADMLFKLHGLSAKEKASILDSKARISVSMGMMIRDLIEASKLAADRKRNRGNKARSFSPEQIVQAVQVTVNNTPEPPKA